MTTPPKPDVLPPSTAATALALARSLPALLALAPAEVVPVTLHPGRAAFQARDAAADLRPLRARLADELPRARHGAFAALDDYALAFLQTDALLRGIAHHPPPTARADITAEGRVLRARLIVDLRPAARSNAAIAALLAKLHMGTGRLRVMEDLLNLATCCRQQWPALADRSVIDAAAVARAEGIAKALVDAADPRKPRPEWRDAADLRARACTLMTRTHAAARRAVAYVYWNEPDVLARFPSLYEMKPKRPSRRTRAAVNVG